ncbi:MAG: DNA-binding protein [Methylococcaceae bacterium]|nr:DNA-binding protein [Methylococcaceae bacterium]
MAIERIVTDSAVFEIADQLTAKGEKVTNRAIWSAIGGGSMTTVSQSLRRWKEQQEIQVSQPIERTPLPAALVEVLHNAAAQLWETAQAETKAELEQLAQAMNARIAEAQSERDDTLAELQTTAEELEQVKAERDTALLEIERQKQVEQVLRQVMEKGDTELDAQRLVITQATHRADTAEAHRAELSARVDQLSQLLTDEQTAHRAEAIELRGSLEKSQATAAAELAALKAEYKAETTKLRTTLETAQAEKSRLDGMLSVYEAIGGSSGKQPEAEPSKPKKERVKKATDKTAVDRGEETATSPATKRRKTN